MGYRYEKRNLSQIRLDDRIQMSTMTSPPLAATSTLRPDFNQGQ